MLAALCLVTAVGLSGCSGDTSITPPTAAPDNANARAQAGQRALDALATSLDSGRPDTGLVAAGSTSLVPAIAANAAALEVRNVDFDYVETDPTTPSAAALRRWGPGTWVGVARLEYRLPADPGPTQMEVAVTFARQDGRVRIAAVGGHGHRSPLWLRGPASILQVGRLWVIAAGHASTGRWRDLGRTALHQVGLVLPRWKGALVVEVPRTKDELDSVLDADADTYRNIAAVTTSIDGSLAPRAPIHVLINPAVFGTLERRGAQVVLTHESTHVATKGPLSSMPTWLLEGFADYVALAHAGVPTSLAARQILAQVRAKGVPTHLPTATELAPTAGGLGARYEEAWTVCRYLAATYGEARLVRLYDLANGGLPLGRAFPRALGVPETTAVAGWRADLARLAGVPLGG